MIQKIVLIMTVFFFCIATITAVSADSQQNQITWDVQEVYNLSGFIINGTNTGLSGATVSGNGSLGAIVSGIDGNYSFDATNGTYFISATLASYTPNYTIVTVMGTDEINRNITLAASGGIETFVNPIWVLISGTFILVSGWFLKRWGNRRRRRQ